MHEFTGGDILEPGECGKAASPGAWREGGPEGVPPDVDHGRWDLALRRQHVHARALATTIDAELAELAPAFAPMGLGRVYGLASAKPLRKYIEEAGWQQPAFFFLDT